MYRTAAHHLLTPLFHLKYIYSPIRSVETKDFIHTERERERENTVLKVKYRRNTEDAVLDQQQAIRSGGLFTVVGSFSARNVTGK